MAVKKKHRNMKNEITTKMHNKLLVVFLIVTVLLLVLAIILIRISMKKNEDYSKAVYDNFKYDSKTISAKRGDITDRNGTILAYSAKVYNMILDTKVLLASKNAKEPTLALLKKHFPELDMNELNSFIAENEEATIKSTYRRLLMGLTADEIADFKAEMAENKDIKGLWFEEQYQRMYPYNSLASDLIGFASESNGGELGMESQYQSYLAGTDGRTYGYIDDNNYVSETINPTNGCTIVSTIDYTIQNIVERAISSFNKEYGSVSTSAVVMDPNTGEVLAMADYPTFDLNNPRDLTAVYTQEQLDKLSDEEMVDAYYKLWSNSTISWLYEPGSVFKSFVVASAIEEGLAHTNDVWTCDAVAVYNGASIHCHNLEGHGDITSVGALVYSCNDALMQMGAMLGKTRFNRYLHIFQFGQKTAIDLPGEEQGLLINENNMMDVDLATNSFGQNLNVNMVQMTAAFASLINGGYYYQPYTVKEVRNASGDTVVANKPTLVARTISSQTSEEMRQYFRAVVDFGAYWIASLEGYSMGGKSGTAQKAGRLDDSFVVSFMGFLEAENPQFLIYVVIDSPQIETYNNSSAAQMIFHEIAANLTMYYGIPQTKEDYWLKFKVNADDPTYRTAPAYDPESTLLRTPIPEDELTDGEDVEGEPDLADRYPDGATPGQNNPNTENPVNPEDTPPPDAAQGDALPEG